MFDTVTLSVTSLATHSVVVLVNLPCLALQAWRRRLSGSRRTRAKRRVALWPMRHTVTATGSVSAVSPSCTTVRTASCTRASTAGSPRVATILGGPTTVRGSSWPVRSPGSHLFQLPTARLGCGARCFITVLWFPDVTLMFTALTPC